MTLHLSNLQNTLLMRGYDINQIKERFDKTKAFIQMDLLTKQQEKKTIPNPTVSHSVWQKPQYRLPQ